MHSLVPTFLASSVWKARFISNQTHVRYLVRSRLWIILFLILILIMNCFSLYWFLMFRCHYFARFNLNLQLRLSTFRFLFLDFFLIDLPNQVILHLNLSPLHLVSLIFDVLFMLLLHDFLLILLQILLDDLVHPIVILALASRFNSSHCLVKFLEVLSFV